MTRPGKISSQAGVELQTLHFRGGSLIHLANEAVASTDMTDHHSTDRLRKVEGKEAVLDVPSLVGSYNQ